MMKYKSRIIFSLLLVAFSLNGQVRLYNKGMMFVETSSEASLYINGDIKAGDASAIHQKGKTVLIGNFLNSVVSGNVFSGTYSTGVFEFRGSNPQKIEGEANKAQNYINFPSSILVNNRTADSKNATVTLDADMGATITNMNFTRGRFVLDSKPNQALKNSRHAHLLVKGDIEYKTNASSIQVNLSLGNNYTSKKLAGFTPPFRTIYADYFFYNFLSRPTNKGLFGNTGRLIIDPRTPLKGGLGYIIGMGIIPTGDEYYYEFWDPRWSNTLEDDKATDLFSFAREIGKPSFTQYITTENAPDCFTGEQLITEDVRILLEQGFNYLGNPFTVPLDMTDFVENTHSGDWGVSRGSGGSGEVRNGFYVMSSGHGSYSNGLFTFNASYLLAQTVGGTVDKTDGKYLLAPMQLFIVGKNTQGTTYMTIPVNKRTHGGANYLRSTNGYEITDELLIETTDEETEGYDRLCIVFRPDASLKADDMYDAPKLFNRSGGVNQIYTRSSDRKELTTNTIPADTKQLVMYFVPNSQPQNVTLTADRMNSLLSVAQVVLEDTKTGIKTDLTKTPTYSFHSDPADRADRFILHFSSSPTGLDELAVTRMLTANYNAGCITIHGLQHTDLGRDLSVYNMQGQLLHKERIADVTLCRIYKSLHTGIYLIKIDDNPQVMKLSVK